MSWYSKVVWSEGLFLSPQLFQQQERYLEAYAHQRSLGLSPFYWGFHDVAIDQDALSLGKLVLRSAAGVFQDGTPFSAPHDTLLPAAYTIKPADINQTIYLAIPTKKPHAEEVSLDDNLNASTRYFTAVNELRDANSLTQAPRSIQLAQLRLCLRAETAMNNGWIGLPLAKITALHAHGGAVCEQQFIPPLLRHRADPLLSTWLDHIRDLTRLRADALAAQLTHVARQTADAPEINDYFLLQILNRYQACLDHQLRVIGTHPEPLYALLLAFAGELSTFARPSTRRPVITANYLHEQPYVSFRGLIDDLQVMLNDILIRSAERIQLHERQHGVHIAQMTPASFSSFSTLVLGIAADMPAEVLRQQFIARSKFGPMDKLPELIRSHLPGIAINALPVAPRQIPFSAGYLYFEFTSSGVMWEQIKKHGSLAMHIAGDFPGLHMELWGIRTQQ
jgi:type VI secretion system protein ImpJ